MTHVMVSPMRRAVQTALLCASKERVDGNGKIKIIFTPILREQVTYKNTVASSIPEIKNFVNEILSENNIDESLFDFDYSLLNDDQLWYLRQIKD